MSPGWALVMILVVWLVLDTVILVRRHRRIERTLERLEKEVREAPVEAPRP